MLSDGMIQIEETKDPTNVCRALHENHHLYEPLVGEGIRRQADKWSLNGLPEKYTFFNILSNHEPVGFQAIKSLSADTLYLVGLYFNREAQGKGFGTTLLRRLKEDALAKGFKKIVLLAHEEASWALGFYEKNGFRAVTTDRDQMVDYIPEIEPYCLSNTLLMAMDLTQRHMG